MAYRVIQWATGNVGRLAIEAVLAHPELELAGVWVHSPEKAGMEFGGVAATNDVDEVLGLDADCVVYTPLLGHTAEVARILEAGKNVVTPVGWFYPKDTAGIAELEAACRAGSATLHGTGIHPGGITERFPLTLSALCTNIRHVRAEEFSDIRNYQAEAVVRDVMLFGKPPEEAAKSPMLDILGSGFSQSVRMVGDALGLALEEKLQTSHEMAFATKDLDTPVGLIPAGTVAAQRFTWEGLVNGEVRVTARVNWLMGEDLDPPWKLGGERFEVGFDADPPLEVTFHGLHPPVVGQDIERNRGLLATANHCVNSVPYVCDAEPGVKTYLDLPLIAGRAAAVSCGRGPRRAPRAS